MPLYEYQCDVCRHRFERIQRFSDPAVDVCPECGGAVKKLLSSPAIQFKGSGWYITDYAKKPSGSDSKPPADSTEKPAPAASGDAAASSSSTKESKAPPPSPTKKD